MKVSLTFITLILLGMIALQAQPERVGQAGASQLLINSMPRSSAFNGLDVASSDGIESSSVNPAGVARTTGTELLFSHTRWLVGTDIGINSFGFSQALGRDNGSLGLIINAFNLGEFTRTTVEQPDGTLGSFRVTYMNIGLSYAKKFTDRIHVGTTARVINQATPEVSSTGFALDAGIQYRTGKKDRLKLGISLKNIGPTMRFRGDGLNTRAPFEPSNNYTSIVTLNGDRFEIPATLSMGGSMDFFLGESNTITVIAGFISNSFYFNQGGLGLAYSYKKYVTLRGSFLYEKGIFGEVVGVDGRYNAYTGFSTGATFQIPFKTDKLDASGNPDFSKFSLDMSYRTTNPFDGTFVFGARIDI